MESLANFALLKLLSSFPQMIFITYYLHGNIFGCVNSPVQKKFAAQDWSYFATPRLTITRNSLSSQNFQGRNVPA